MYALRDKTILITGASEGIGAELARQLAYFGNRLVLAARSADKLDAVAQQCRQFGSKVIVVPTDVTQQADCKNMVDQTLEAFGGIDVLINNAGVSMHAWFEDIEDFSTYQRLFQINVMGAVYCTHYALPHIKASKGLVVGVSSLAGKTGVPARTTYCASKFAMAGFFDALRVELMGTGVDVCMIYPGVVDTEIRRNGLNNKGERAGVSGLAEKGAMTVQQCAKESIDAMQARKREWIMTTKARFGLWLKMPFPSVVDKMARAALDKDHGGPKH